jgi:hypothetical protein
VDYGVVTSPTVLTGISDLVGPSTIARQDGVQVDADAGALGGKFGTYPLRVGGGDPLRLYSLIVRASTVESTPTDIADIERYVGTKVGVPLSGAARDFHPSGWYAASQWLTVVFVASILSIFLAGCAMIVGGCELDAANRRAVCDPGGMTILVTPDAVFKSPVIIIRDTGGGV